MKRFACIPVLAIHAAAQSLSMLPPTGGVALPLDEYNRLLEMAARPAPRSTASPVPFAIQSAQYSLTVNGEIASGRIDLDGEVFASGPVKAPVASGLTVLDARRQGTTLPLLLENGSHVAVLEGPAPFHISLDVALPVSSQPGRALVVIPPSQAGTVRLSLTVPGERTALEISGGIVTARSSSGGRTKIDAVLAGGTQATAWWAARDLAPPETPKEIRFTADAKTMITAGDAEVTAAVLADIAVLQGNPSQFTLPLPDGWEITGVTGATLESSDVQGGSLLLKVNSAARAHSFLITLARAVNSASVQIAPLSFTGAQRETGEILIEGEGAMELVAKESGGVKRMDVKEASPYLRSMALRPAQAAFRYHRQPGETPAVAVEWSRFPDSALPPAIAQQATVTTLVTSQGNSLTEVRLTMRNREQPFLKLALPAGWTIVSADVAGEAVKPVEGADGSRIPLLRAGFRPTGSYVVSFVIRHSGSPFARKGDGELLLPKMDLPVGLMEWEVFLPAQYRVRNFGGDALSAAPLPRGNASAVIMAAASPAPVRPLEPGMIGGSVRDPSGAAVPNTAITVTHTATGRVEHTRTDPAGNWVVLSIPPGEIRIEANAAGFRREVRAHVQHAAALATRVDMVLQVGALNETVEVAASADTLRDGKREERQNAQAAQQASVNVLNLQRRVAGVLPIPVEVPKAGLAYHFVRPLLVNEETRLTFSYRMGK